MISNLYYRRGLIIELSTYINNEWTTFVVRGVVRRLTGLQLERRWNS